MHLDIAILLTVALTLTQHVSFLTMYNIDYENDCTKQYVLDNRSAINN